MGRVWLSVQAAESSLRAGEIRKAIKAARYEGDMLEIRLSALASPSRIEAVAASSMGMTEAREVTYIDLSAPEAVATQPTATRDAGAQSARGSVTGIDRVVADALDLAATEAQILLVGDVALASTR
jgi:ketosteroid isomerase-like protein